MLEQARQLLNRYYGYSDFRGGQEKVIETILQGKDTCAVMPTGAGKSICYQIPALLLSGVTLVISPLISLMKDQVDGLVNIGIPATFINSSLGIRETRERIRRAAAGEFKLIYAAPERLESDHFWSLLAAISISMIAVDEAHCVSQWGHDFRPSYRSIAPMIAQLPNRPIISAFTATATDEVKGDIVNLLTLKDPKIFVTGFNRPNLSFTVVRGENKRDFLLNYIGADPERVGIIYAATRKEVENICEFLQGKGYNAGKYHAGLTDQERKDTQDAFLFDNINIIVATNAFGMGIDKSNVRYVIHYNLPKNMEAYYQEAGRAGRDGEASECILLFGAQDVLIQKYLIEQTIRSPERQTQQYKMLQSMVDYCHTPRCLRRYILEYFGEEGTVEYCGNCSNCNDETELVDITIEAQKIFSCIYRMQQRWGSSMVAQVLRGSSTKKVFDMGFNRLSTYGIMAEYTIKAIRDMINMLIADEYLALSEGKYPIIQLQEKAIPVLRGDEQVFQRMQKKKTKVIREDTLFERLRTLRKEISTRENIPPYHVFADGTLREMDEYCPVDGESFLAMKGVGEAKLQRYGTEFLAVIQDYIVEYGNSARKKELNLVAKTAKQETKKRSHVITSEMFIAGKTLQEIAAERELTITTIQDHLIKGKKEGLNVNLDHLIPEEYEYLILKVVQEVGSERLKPIKEALPDEVEYMAIKAVLCKYDLK